MDERASARRRLSPGKASNYIKPIDTIKPGDKVILCCRVSTHEQGRTKKLARQVAYLRRKLEDRGAVIIFVVEHEGAGCDPYWLAKATEMAKTHGAKLVAESTCRFIRHPAYHSKDNWTAQARDLDLQELWFWTEGVTLVTLIDPDASPEQEKAIQTHRGQCASGRKGGRPKQQQPGYKKRQRLAMLPRVLRLREFGATFGEIARKTGLPRSTVQDWVEKHS